MGIYGELNGNHLKDFGSGFHSHITQQLHGDIMKTCLSFQLEWTINEERYKNGLVSYSFCYTFSHCLALIKGMSCSDDEFPIMGAAASTLTPTWVGSKYEKIVRVLVVMALL